MPFDADLTTVPLMISYSLRRMRIGGDLGHVLMVSHPDDEAALAHARAFGCGRAVEVWAGERCLATVLPGAKLQATAMPA